MVAEATVWRNLFVVTRAEKADGFAEIGKPGDQPQRPKESVPRLALS